MGGVIVVGAGGAIGSHLVGHLARIPSLRRLTLVDWGTYEPGNLHGQDISRADVGRFKARAQARRVRRIRQDVDVRPVVADVAALPLGMLRAHVICACLDSRWARQRVNEAAWRLGVPWVDAGVYADGWLARVDVFRPAEGQPCLECGWGEQDYAVLEQAYACSGVEVPATAPTASPSPLGGLAAAVQAMRVRRLLDGTGCNGDAGMQVVMAMGNYRTRASWHRHNPRCRMSHAGWTIEPLALDPERATLGGLLDTAARRHGAAGASALALRVEGKAFVREWSCPACGDTRKRLRLDPTTLGGPVRCRRCAAPMRPVGWATDERLDLGTLGRRMRERNLARLGVARHEVVSVETGAPTSDDAPRTTHYELRTGGAP